MEGDSASVHSIDDVAMDSLEFNNITEQLQETKIADSQGVTPLTPTICIRVIIMLKLVLLHLVDYRI